MTPTVFVFNVFCLLQSLALSLAVPRQLLESHQEALLQRRSSSSTLDLGPSAENKRPHDFLFVGAFPISTFFSVLSRDVSAEISVKEACSVHPTFGKHSPYVRH